MAHTHHDWLAKWEHDVQKDYAQLHEAARRDPQYSGHGAEGGWHRLLEAWLPSTYPVRTRKYIVPEDGDDAAFETDLVVFNPGYPRPLLERTEVMAGGVAAAFSVKLTLDAAGIRDAVERAARLRRSAKPRYGSPRDQMLGPFAAGLLAHSHDWKAPSSTPRDNIAKHLWTLDHEIAVHPRESIDFVCVADLTSIHTMRMPYLAPEYAALSPTPGLDSTLGVATTAMVMADEVNEPGPIAMFIAALICRFAQTDPALKPMADAFRVTNTLGSGRGSRRSFAVSEIFDERIVNQLPTRIGFGGDWDHTLF